MDHAVHYRTAAGETRLEEAGSLDAAISLVERLRNDDEGVSDVRVYRQVPIEFKTYYKVSVVGERSANGQAETATPTPAPASPPTASAASAAPQSPQDPPPGAMPLSPSTPTAQPSAQPSAQAEGQAAGGDEGGDGARRGSLFSRG